MDFSKLEWLPQSNPGANYLAHQNELDVAIQRVLSSGWYILGAEVSAFEREFAGYNGANFAMGVANGTDALELALRAACVGAGDAVFTVSHTAVATVAAIRLTGATPILVDIDPISYTIDPDKLEEKIKSVKLIGTLHPKAIIPVHLYGHPADMEAVMALAMQYGLMVIEDCAQSHGASHKGKLTGTWGELAAFSFYPTKNLGALGDGGAITTNDPALAERIRLLAQYGWRKRYISEIEGQNSRLDELQAAVLRVKLSYLDRENNRRKAIADLYSQKLASTGLILPAQKPESAHVFHQYVIRVNDRDNLVEFLSKYRIRIGIHYPVPVHLQPAYSGKLEYVEQLDVTEKIAREVISLPMYPELTDFQVERVVQALQAWLLDRAGF